MTTVTRFPTLGVGGWLVGCSLLEQQYFIIQEFHGPVLPGVVSCVGFQSVQTVGLLVGNHIVNASNLVFIRVCVV